MKKKILFCTSSTIGGGAERMLFNIIQSLNENFEKRLLITSDAKVPDCIDLNSTKVINFGRSSAKYSFFQIVRQFRDFRPEYVFTTSYNIGYLLILAKLLLNSRAKIIIRCAVAPSEIYNKTDFKERILKFIQRLTYNKAFLIIAQTDFMKNDIIKSYNVRNEKVMTIRNIINIKEVVERSRHFTPNELKDENYNIVAAGALYSVKGFDILIHAISELVREYPQIKLYILGEERNEIGYRNKLEYLISQNNLSKNITLLGQKSNPYPYIRKSNLFVMSSRKEGFPNVILEALTLKTPVVATNCVDFSNVIWDGINGYVVEKNNMTALKNGIERAINTNFNLDIHSISNFDYNKLFI